MQGNLSDRTLAEILRDIRRLKASGILRLENGTQVRQLFIDSGAMIRFAASNLPTERLTTLFEARAGVNAEQVRQAAASKFPQELLGTTLVRLGLLEREQLAGLTEEHIRQVMRLLLSLDQGTYRFQPGDLPFRDQIDGGISMSEVLMIWARDLVDPAAVRRHLGSPDKMVARSSCPPQGYEKVPLDATAGFVLSRLDMPMSMRDLCTLSPVGEDQTLKALLGLSLGGLIDVADSSAEAGRPAPRTRNAEPVASRNASKTPATPAASAAPAPPTGRPPAARRSPAVTKPQSPRSGPPGTGTAGRADSRPPTAAVSANRIPGNGGPPPGPEPKSPPAAAAPVRAGNEIESEVLARYARLNDQSMYEVLEIETTVSRDDVRRAYYALARKLHPDKFRDEALKARAEKVFARITEAYSTLNRDEPRKRYDDELAMHSGHGREEKTVDPTEMARMNFKRGKDQFLKKRYPQALSFLENACQQDPARGEYFYYLGMTQAHNPRLKKEAEANFLKSIKLEPTNADAYAQLGTFYVRSGQSARGQEMYRKALQWDATNAAALEGLESGRHAGKKGFLGMFSKK